MRLNVGCGAVRRKREFGVDYYPTAAADVRADLFALPFADSSAEVIRLDHVLEHLPRKSVVRALLEAKRVLKSGGKLTAGIPDMLALCEAYHQADLAGRIYFQGYLFGSQTRAGQYHNSGWDAMTLRSVLESVGFIRVRARNDWAKREGLSLRVRAVKA
jgi:ubiquinone/menaquinone biosynthesis C-methylase UbiE